MNTTTSATLLALLLAATSAAAQPSVGVSIGINQPGVYGRIDIGNVAPPPLVYARPIIIAPQPAVIRQEPVYLYAPPGHQKNWAKHCAKYAACGQPVYFVQERWVRERYEASHDGEQRGHKEKKDKKAKKGHDHD
jgi:hypothetical protein